MAAPRSRWTITYLDGSANRYTFTGAGDSATFEYDPVTPERSSTGMYSGGDPRSGRLDRAQVSALWQQIRAFEANPVIHTPDRAKGTGDFTIVEDEVARSFIIVRGPALLGFDAFVKAL
jgi:hypothetical protein